MEQEILAPIATSRVQHMTDAAMTFHRSLDESARQYLADRGLAGAAKAFGLGSVHGDDPEFTIYKGMLAIPFWNPNGQCMSIRFRRIDGSDGPKYLQPAGSITTPFNLRALTQAPKTIVITEGEFDAMSLAEIGIPAIGLPGANSWKPHYARLLDGVERVIVWGDPDDAGREFNQTVLKSIPRAIPAYMDVDINEALQRDTFVSISEAFQRAGGEL